MLTTKLNNIGAFVYKNQDGESVTVSGESAYTPLLITLKPSKYTRSINYSKIDYNELDYKVTPTYNEIEVVRKIIQPIFPMKHRQRSAFMLKPRHYKKKLKSKSRHKIRIDVPEEYDWRNDMSDPINGPL